MVPILPRWLMPAALCAVSLAAQAQSATPTNAGRATPATRPDPLDAKASVPALSYESPFSRYRPLSDDKAVSWREANDEVTRIGGWRAYAREAQAPASATPDANAGAPASSPAGAHKGAADPMPTTRPAPQGHSGHKSP